MDIKLLKSKKHPICVLNELDVEYRFKDLMVLGPPHNRMYGVEVSVADMTFEGWGHSKREARAAAARACLAAFLARAGRVLPAPSKHQDFTADEGVYPVPEFQYLDTRRIPEPVSVPDMNHHIKNTEENSTPPVSQSPGASLFGTSVPQSTHKSPINVLYENYPGLTFACSFGDGSPLDAAQAPLQLAHSMRFKVVCQIKDQKFEGYGSSKKLAKLAAARSALAVLEERRVEPLQLQQHQARAGFLHQTLADHIANLINEKFSEMMKLDVVHSKRKALAGIVITINNKIEGAKVIAVTTGTKCVSGEHMSVRGRAVNDCHAEVAARRCLQRHLYAQLLMYASQPNPRVPILESDLEPVPGGGYQLKPNREVHLYISTAPCGDGRIFSPHEQHEPEPDRHPNRLARGQLRTKIESGEGTIPVKNCSNVVQTWDGVMQGERLLTMSCSDKVARWCVVGMQGALLSRLLRPVYLHSLILGSLLHPHHMYRAICGRIEAFITSLPPPYRLQRPLLARAASTEARTPARAPSFSVCWSCTTPAPEVLNATTGKLENGQPSLLCKQSMFARWQYVVRRLPHLPQDVDDGKPPLQLPSGLESLLYNEAKQLCPAYQAAKERLVQAFEKAKLGRWIKKPLEQDQFVCELLDADPKALFAWAGHCLPGRSAMQVGHYEVKELGQSPITAHLANVNNTQNDEISVLNIIGGIKDDDKFSALDETDDFANEVNNYDNGKVVLEKVNDDVDTVKGCIDRVCESISSLDINKNYKYKNADNIVKFASTRVLNRFLDKNFKVMENVDNALVVVNDLGKFSKNHKDSLDSSKKVTDEQLSFKFPNKNNIDNTDVCLPMKSNRIKDHAEICNTVLKGRTASAPNYYDESKLLKNVKDAFISEERKSEINYETVNKSLNQSPESAYFKNETNIHQIDISNKENSETDNFDRKEKEVKKFTSLRLNKLISCKMRFQENLESTPQKTNQTIINANVDKTDTSASKEKNCNINDSVRQQLDLKQNNKDSLDTENIIKSKLLRRKLECIRKISRDPM